MASQEDVAFRCKLCQFTASSKLHMADHFMDVHAAVEVIGSGSQPPTAPAQGPDDIPSQTADGDGGTAEDGETSDTAERQAGTSNGATSKKKPGFRSNAIRSTISHLVRAAEQASTEELTGHSGMERRSQRVKPTSAVKEMSTTVHAVGRELRKYKIKRKFEDFIVYHVYTDDQPKNKRAKPLPAKGIEGKRSSHGKKARSKRRVAESQTSPKTKPEDEEEVTVTLSISPFQFKRKSDEELQKWSEKWSEKHRALLETCDNANCSLELSATEMKLHKQCHMKNYYGFKCPHCEYMHSRWRNMRCHIYDDHNAIEKPLLKCDWPGCSASFTVMWGLRRHVLRDHIRHKVTKILTGEEEEPSAETEEKEETTETIPDSEEPKRGPDYRAEKRVRKTKRKKKGVEEIVDAGTQEEEAAQKMRKKKKFHRIAWLPSCSVCEAKYISIENMDAHMALHTVEGSDNVKCTECEFVAEKQSDLKSHMKQLHKRLLKVYRCELCKYAGDRHFDYKKHLLTHGDTKPCMCEVCGKLMSTRYNLKVHRLRVHATEAEKTLQCAHCSYRCADRIVLKDHMRFQHNLMWNGDLYRDTEKIPLFKCNMCDYVGRKEKSLKYHMRVHTEDRQFRCHICSYASKTKNNLILHMRTHGGMKPVKCPQCDYRGATNKVVNEHVLSKHTGIRPFRCPCGWSTSYSGNMWKHMQLHRERGDAYKDMAEERYGGQKAKKKKGKTDKGALAAQPASEQQVITIVHEFTETKGNDTQIAEDTASQPTEVITVSDGSMTTRGAVVPIIEGEVQLDSLAAAVGVVAAAGKDSDQASSGPQQGQLPQDSQAASFLCKLAQAVSTGQQAASKQAAVGKEVPVNSEVPTSDGSVEQTIQELILW